MRSWVSTAPSVLSACTTNKISLHWVISNRTENVRILLDLLCIINSSTDTHAILSIRSLISQLRGTDILIESAFGRTAVEFTQVRIVHFDEGAWDRAKIHVQIVSINVAEVVKIGPS